MRRLSDERIRPSMCPYCATTLGEVTAITTDDTDAMQMPDPGDMTICVECAQILIFNDDLLLQRPKSCQTDSLAASKSESLRLLREVSDAIRNRRFSSPDNAGITARRTMPGNIAPSDNARHDNARHDTTRRDNGLNRRAPDRRAPVSISRRRRAFYVN